MTLYSTEVVRSGNWTIAPDKWGLTVPTGTTALLVLEQADLYQVTENDKMLSDAAGVVRAWQSDDDVMIELGSGKYQFKWREQE